MTAVGDVWRDERFLLRDGREIPHYILILGVDKSYITARLFTTQPHGRPETLGCQLTVGTRPGHFVGVPNLGRMQKPSWVDLGIFDDIDVFDFARDLSRARYTRMGQLDQARLCAVLMCAIQALDTTQRQEARMYAARAALGCQ